MKVMHTCQQGIRILQLQVLFQGPEQAKEIQTKETPGKLSVLIV